MRCSLCWVYVPARAPSVSKSRHPSACMRRPRPPALSIGVHVGASAATPSNAPQSVLCSSWGGHRSPLLSCRRPVCHRSRPRFRKNPSPACCQRESGSGENLPSVAEQWEPPFIPQTIEFALREAQAATAAALVEDATRLIVTLPMGRSRRHWYRLSPLDGELVRGESAVLTLHFAELFKGARMRVVLGTDARPEWTIPWMQKLQMLDDAAYGDDVAAVVPRMDGEEGADGEGEFEIGSDEPDDVLIIGAVSSSQKKQLDMLLARVAPETAVVLFNCLIELPVAPSPFTPIFKHAYVCRSENKTAVLHVGYGPEANGWHVYTETAIFEYEWVGCRREPDWLPTSTAIEKVVQARGSKRRTINGYWESVASGCESGFWPFCTIACRDVCPVPGSKFEKKGKSQRSNSKPFGFF